MQEPTIGTIAILVGIIVPIVSAVWTLGNVKEQLNKSIKASEDKAEKETKELEKDLDRRLSMLDKEVLKSIGNNNLNQEKIEGIKNYYDLKITYLENKLEAANKRIDALNREISSRLTLRKNE